jgi:hypothetical protein
VVEYEPTAAYASALVQEPIITTAASVWMDDGILHIESNGRPSTRESVSETLDAVRSIIGGAPKPVLFDARRWPKGDPEAWIAVIQRMQESFSAVAMLLDANSPGDVGEYPTVIDRLLIPFRVFTDEAEALASLNSG